MENSKSELQRDTSASVEEMKASIAQDEKRAKLAKVATGFGLVIIMAIVMSI